MRPHASLSVAATLILALCVGLCAAAETYPASLRAGDEAAAAGRHDEAVGEYEAAAAQAGDPTEHAVALGKLARVHLHGRRDHDAARATAERALAITDARPIGRVTALEVLARCQMRSDRDFDGAAETIRRAMELEGVEWAQPNLALMLGDCHRLSGRAREAIASYERALGMAQAGDALKGVAHLNIGLTQQYGLRSPAEARASYGRAVELNPDLRGEVEGHLRSLGPDRAWPPNRRAERPAGSERRADVEDTPAMLLMHYMPWYTTPEVQGEWGGHWTGWESQHDPEEIGEDGLPDIWSHYHPLIGTYDSADPDVVECHLLQMKLAGVDGVIADWYGISDVYDYPPTHRATKVLFEQAGRLGMSFAACFEDRSVESNVKLGRIERDEIAEHLTETFAWMQEHWFEGPQHVRVDGRPLLLNFGPIYVSDAAAWEAAFASLPRRPKFYALHHLWRGVNADGGFTWVHKSVWEGDPTGAEIRERLRREYTHSSTDPREIIVSALPGFHDVYEHSYGHLEHRGGATLRESLGFCLDGPWPIVQLVTWNDYGEGTMIEPTHEFGYTFLEIIQELRREELGASFVCTVEDLRLPARVLALRRAGDVADERLDRVVELLASGECGRARDLLDTIERE